MKQLDAFADPGEIKRREVVLDPQVSPEEIKRREVELGYRQRVVLLLLQLFPNGGATDIVFVTVLHSSSDSNCVVTVQCQMDTALTSWCSGGGLRQPWSSGLVPVSKFHSFFPAFPLVPVFDRPTCLCGR